MASTFCTLIHPSKNKRHYARVADGQISSIKQQASKQLEQATQLRNLALEQIDSAYQQMQQEIAAMYQAATSSAVAELVVAQNLHQEALVRLSCLWIYGKASLHAKYVEQEAALLQARDLALQNLPLHITDRFGNVYDKHLNNLTAKLRKENPDWHARKLKREAEVSPEAHIKIKDFTELSVRYKID